ncbi:MAG: polysaccharide biosynthesis tyrosine autokinase [Candidatus Marinimicrobia bacterium]|nr:polysaccharide biosynthesis tyrosine autokinase [Candidatus Neomarinimicrobiota bacterium]
MDENNNISGVEEELNLREIIYIILRNKWIIIISFLVIISLTLIYTLRSPDIYQSSSLLLIENQNQSFINPFSSMGNSRFDINNEVKILKSRSLSKRTVSTLKNNYNLDSLYLFKKGADPDKKSLKQRFFSIFKNNGNGAEAIDMNNIYIKRLKEIISVETTRETQTINISIESRDPNECAIIVNTFVKEYVKNDLERAASSSGRIKSFLSEQLEKIQNKLSDSENELQQYQQKEGVVNLEENSKIMIEKSSEFESIYFTAKAELEIAISQIKHLKENLSDKEKDLLNETLRVANPMINFLKQTIASKEANLAEIENQMQGSSVNISSIKDEIKNLQKRLTKETKLLLNSGYIPGPESPFKSNQDIVENILKLETQKISLKARVKEYKKLNDYYLSQLEKLPRKNIDFIRLKRTQQVNEKLYIMMKEKYEESRISEASKIGSIYVIDKAIPNIDPIKPKKKMNVLIGAILGLGIGFAIAFIKESLDNTIKGKEDLTKLGVTVLSVIPKIGISKGKKHISDSEYLRSKLITYQEPRSPISEAFRSFRTNIELTKIDKTLNTFAVTSSTSGEGKTTTIVNLAISFAQFGHKTLLVDADMRKPVINKMFNVDRSPGLSELIIKKSTFDEAIKKTDIKNLSILPSGNIPPNPSELIGSQKMKDLVKELSEKYDKIFFDAPPVLAVTDPILIGKFVDGLFFVARSEITDIELIKHTLETMQSTKTPLIGGVINEVTSKSLLYGKYYHYYHYHYKYKYE